MSEDSPSTNGGQPPSEEPKKPVPSEEIVLTEGKTLSDYLEDDPAKDSPGDAPVYRSISNVESLVVPPPGGVLRARERAGAGSEDARAQEDEGRGRKEKAPVARTGESPGAVPQAPFRVGLGGPEAITARGAVDLGGSAADAAGEPEAEEENFGAMFERSLKAKSFETGQTVRGRVVAISPDVAFLDIGGKSEATIDIGELRNDDGDIEIEVGEFVEAKVVSTEGGLKLSRRLARGAAAKSQLGDAFRAGLPVEGRVEKSIKGGYEIRIAGQRGFCPISQIDLIRTADPEVHVGKVYTFRIIEFKDRGKNLVVSRRRLLQEDEQLRGEETRKLIVEGAVLAGRVVSVREYGAFVDLGGVQGLLHVSEMGWARVASPAELVKPGDEIRVKVLKIDEENKKISLGMRQLQEDPWEHIAEKYAVGQVRTGRIVRFQEFGAFVELEPGIEALAHVSTFSPTGTAAGWKKAIPLGSSGEFEVLSVDPERKRIGVALHTEGASRAESVSGAGAAESAEATGAMASRGDRGSAARAGDHPGSRASGSSQPRPARPPRAAIATGTRMMGKIERHETFGVFVFLAPGRTGLMPLGETATQRGTDLKKVFPVGSEVEVMVLDADPSGKRIRLSRKALLDAEERADAKEFTTRSQTQETFGSIGDKLRAALSGDKK